MSHNKKHKSSVFTALFEDPVILRELYCALENVSLPPDVPIIINTLKNVLYMGKYNDISFVIDGKLVVLIEHQSTINPNMTLRLLLYIARVLEKIVESKTMYSEKRITIPWPEFFVLYNGIAPFPDDSVLKLSDLFERPQSLGLPEKLKPLLELEVRVININKGSNSEILKRCAKLNEYSIFIEKIREFMREFDNLEESIKEAVKHCHKHGILKKFLEIHGSEVLNMLYTEWNLDDAKQVWYEDGREDGLAEGRIEGRVEEKLIIAKNLLSKGSTPEFVMEITGLSLQEIDGFKN